MPLVVMSREMGSLGRDVAIALAQAAGKQVVYHELIDSRANRGRVRKTHVERFLDGSSGLWERLTAEATGRAMYTAEQTFDLLKDGRTAVLRGWGAVHLLKDLSHVVRVRICAPLELRVSRMMERLGSDNHEAVLGEIQLADEAGAAIARRNFKRGWRDAEEYDLVLNTERCSVDECVDELEWLLKRERYQETEASRAQVDDLALAWAVRSALRRDSRTASSALTVDCSRAAVTLRGVVEDRVQAKVAAEIAAGVAGVRDVVNQVRGTSGLQR